MKAKITVSLTLLSALLLVGLMAFEPQVRQYYGGARVAPYRFIVMQPADMNRAIAMTEARIERDRTSGLERAGLASLYIARGKLNGDVADYDKAREIAKASLKLLPFSNTGAKVDLALIAEARHEFKDAIRLANEVLKERPGAEGYSILVTAYLAMGDLDQAAYYAEKLCAKKPSLGNLALRGLVMNAMGRDVEAESDFIHALSLEDAGEMQESAWVRSLLARFYLKQGRVSDAEDLLRETLRIVPQYPLALDLQGQCLLQRKEFKAAADKFFEAFTVSRQLPYFRNYGKATELMGNLQLAKEVLHQGEKTMRRELASGQYGHRVELAQLLLDRGDSSAVKEAIGLVQDELKIRHNVETLRVLARAYIKAHEWAQGQEAIQKALQTGLHDPGLYHYAAVIESGLKNSERVRLYQSLGKKTNPSYFEVSE